MESASEIKKREGGIDLSTPPAGQKGDKPKEAAKVIFCFCCFSKYNECVFKESENDITKDLIIPRYFSEMLDWWIIVDISDFMNGC